MSSGDWIKYRIYCNTEAAWKEVIVEYGDPLPTACPTDTAHAVNPNSVDEIDRRTQNETIIIEETGSVKTGGHFQCGSRKFTFPANQVTSIDWSEPIPMAGYAIRFTTGPEHEGDCVDLYVAPNTIVGWITANVSIGDTLINVSQTVVDNIKVGFMVDLFNGPNTDKLGRVKVVDKNGLKITVETAATMNFSAASPTYVRQSIHYIRNYWLGPAYTHSIGDSKIGGSYIPANTVLRLVYDNKSPSEEKTLIAYGDQTY